MSKTFLKKEDGSLHHISFYNELSQSGSKLLSVDFNAGQGSIKNGLVSSGKLRGFDMYKSNNVAATSTATGKVLAGHISSTATAQTIISTEVLETLVLLVIL